MHQEASGDAHERPQLGCQLEGKLLSVTARAERLHRLALELLDRELTRLGYEGVNPTQAMILLHLSTEDMRVSELTLSGCYQGTNVSYNLKKLIKSRYVVQERSEHDRRVLIVRATKKGCQLLEDLKSFSAEIEQEAFGVSNMNASLGLSALERVEKFMTSRLNALFVSDRQTRVTTHNDRSVDCDT